MQHVLAMFVGNLTPILVIGGACSLGDSGPMVPVKFVFDARAIIPIMIMFICGIDR